jgi:hypothetical protein
METDASWIVVDESVRGATARPVRYIGELGLKLTTNVPTVLFGVISIARSRHLTMTAIVSSASASDCYHRITSQLAASSSRK